MYSEPSEHITLYCDSDGPWYEIRVNVISRTPSLSLAILR
jgi:hypothetical protein